MRKTNFLGTTEVAAGEDLAGLGEATAAAAAGWMLLLAEAAGAAMFWLDFKPPDPEPLDSDADLTHFPSWLKGK